MKQTRKRLGDYILFEHIGAGEYGDVFRGRHIEVDFPVAIKIMKKGGINKSEVEVMRSLNHRNVTRLFDVFEEDDKVGIVMEYGGSESIESQMPLGNIDRVFSIFSQVCDALEYLHCSKKIVHRDLKACNILLDEYDRVKIGDFGFSKKFDGLLSTRCGSPLHVAPEIVKNEAYNEKADIWSLGILLYFMVTRTYPFLSSNIQQLFHQIVSSELKFPQDPGFEQARDHTNPNVHNNLNNSINWHELQKTNQQQKSEFSQQENAPEKFKYQAIEVNPMLRSLISSMLSKDPKDRPSIHEVKNHIWYHRMSHKNSCNIAPQACFRSIDLKKCIQESRQYTSPTPISKFDTFMYLKKNYIYGLNNYPLKDNQCESPDQCKSSRPCTLSDKSPNNCEFKNIIGENNLFDDDSFDKKISQLNINNNKCCEKLNQIVASNSENSVIERKICSSTFSNNCCERPIHENVETTKFEKVDNSDNKFSDFIKKLNQDPNSLCQYNTSNNDNCHNIINNLQNNTARRPIQNNKGIQNDKDIIGSPYNTIRSLKKPIVTYNSCTNVIHSNLKGALEANRNHRIIGSQPTAQYISKKMLNDPNEAYFFESQAIHASNNVSVISNVTSQANMKPVELIMLAKQKFENDTRAMKSQRKNIKLNFMRIKRPPSDAGHLIGVIQKAPSRQLPKSPIQMMSTFRPIAKF